MICESQWKIFEFRFPKCKRKGNILKSVSLVQVLLIANIIRKNLPTAFSSIIHCRLQSCLRPLQTLNMIENCKKVRHFLQLIAADFNFLSSETADFEDGKKLQNGSRHNPLHSCPTCLKLKFVNTLRLKTKIYVKFFLILPLKCWL